MVMVLLGIAAALVAPHMVSFFRGRVLSSEARRMIALTHYGQSRAQAEGVPVLLWIDPKEATFGLTTRPDRVSADTKAVTYTAGSGVELGVLPPDPPTESEDADERLGVPPGILAIRFMPDGYYDDASPSRIILRQDDGAEIDLVPTANRLGYEIAPAKTT